jgi:hypothetical protein
VGRQVVGGAARGRGDHHAVAGEFRQADDAVDRDADLRGLALLAEQRHLVDGGGDHAFAPDRRRLHAQRVEQDRR